MRGGINIVIWMEIRYTKSEDSKESKRIFLVIRYIGEIMERIAASGIQALQILLENNGIILELHLRGKGTD